MAIINCPHCQGKLSFPDDSPPKKVKCPTCAESFTANADKPKTASHPKINLDAEEKAKKSSRKGDEDDTPKRARRTEDDDDDNPRPKKKSDIVDDFDVVNDSDRPRSKRARDDDDRPSARRRRDDDDEDDRPSVRRRRDDDDDDEDDRPSARRRRDEDEDDDRPRSKRRRDDDDDDRPRSRRRRDDEDDDDDRPRSRRGRDDDDDDDVAKPKLDKGSPAQYRNARTGMNLLAIGYWCLVGSLGLIFLLDLLFNLVGSVTLLDFYIIPGLLGIAHWILAAIGISFLMAGPKKGNLLGLCIALTSLAGIHLLILLVSVTDTSFSSAFFLGGRWTLATTYMPFFCKNLSIGVFKPAIAVFLGLVEIARSILLFLVWKELSRASKDRDGAGKSFMLVVGYPCLFAGTIVLFLITSLIAKNAGSEGGTVAIILGALVGACYITFNVFCAIIAGNVRDGVRRPKSI